jgi:hypothetical protein
MRLVPKVSMISLALAVAAGFALPCAPVAQAAPWIPSEACDMANSAGPQGLNGGLFMGATFTGGERLILTAVEPNAFGPATQISLMMDRDLLATAGFPGTITYDFTGPGAIGGVHWESDLGDVTWTVSCVQTPAAASPPIPIWLQSVGRASDVTCSTGYSPSWAMWPNNGTGGYVCDKFVSTEGN